MCLLTFMPKGETISYENARRGAISNPDGFGFAIHTSTAILTDHDMNFEKLWTRFTVARKVQDGPALLHFRIATHGEVNTDNCHPFYIGDEEHSVIAHNGILPIPVPITENRSDTRLFAEIVLPHCGGVERLDDDVFFKELEEWSFGSKMVIMTINPATKCDWYIVNESSGHWGADKIWYSNSSYKYVYTGYVSPYTKDVALGTKTYGWDGWDDYGYGNIQTPVATPTQADGQYELGFAEDDDNILTYLRDELYEDERWVDQILCFTQLHGWDYALVECFNCGAVTTTDATDPSHTHCGDCKACLTCSKNEMCHCWAGYEYHQSFTPTLKEMEAF